MFYEVTYPFGPEGPFSKARLQLKPDRLVNNSVATTAFDTLFDLNLEHLKSSGQCLASTLQEGTISFAGHYQRSIFYNITTSLIDQLSSEVILDKDKDNYKTQIQNDPSSPANVKCGSLGIGTSGKTWYGTPDAWCRSSISMVDIIVPENAGESPGDTTTIEGKVQYKCKTHLLQKWWSVPSLKGNYTRG